MASFKDGILGGFSGKIGNVVGVYRYGKYHMRIAPKRRTKPFSEDELLNHAKFRLVTSILGLIKPLIDVGFNDKKSTVSSLNAAISYTRKNAVLEDGTHVSLDPQKLKISRGDLPTTTAEVYLNTSGNLTLTWDKPSFVGYNHDHLLFLVYAPALAKAEYGIDSALRKEQTCVIEIPAELKDAEVDVYIGFVASDYSCQSESQYLGRVKIS